MTPLEEIMALDSVTINADQASRVLRSNPNDIRQTARQAPERLGFPVICIGSAVKIPRIPFINFLTGGQYEKADTRSAASG